LTSKEPPSKVKDSWILDVPVALSIDNTSRVLKVLNTAFAKLGGNFKPQDLEGNDIAEISAEWTAIKSETSLEGASIYIPNLTIDNVESMSEQEKYDMLSGDMESEIVVLHCHGGAFMYLFPRHLC
jgi:hypothetical protein